MKAFLESSGNWKSSPRALLHNVPTQANSLETERWLDRGALRELIEVLAGVMEIEHTIKVVWHELQRRWRLRDGSPRRVRVTARAPRV